MAQDSAAILFIGPNDFSDTFVDFADQSPFVALFNDCREGVGTIFLGMLPVGNFFPGANTLDALSRGLADLTFEIYNDLLSSKVDNLQDAGINAEIIDYAALANAIDEGPTGFGIIASRSEFLNPDLSITGVLTPNRSDFGTRFTLPRPSTRLGGLQHLRYGGRQHDRPCGFRGC